MEVGDTVEIVNYGSAIWVSKEMWHEGVKTRNKPNNILFEDEDVYCYDMCPQLVGQKGIITKKVNVSGTVSYSLEGPAKVAWYFETQLKLIEDES